MTVTDRVKHCQKKMSIAIAPGWMPFQDDRISMAMTNTISCLSTEELQWVPERVRKLIETMVQAVEGDLLM